MHINQPTFNQCDHNFNCIASSSNIQFCKQCRQVRPKRANPPVQFDRSICQLHQLTYQNICIQCVSLLCKQCLVLSHPYDHRIIKIPKFIEKIANISQNSKSGTQFCKKYDEHSKYHKSLFKNREIIYKLQKRVKVLEYKHLEYLQQKEDSLLEIQKVFSDNNNIINALLLELQQMQTRISKVAQKTKAILQQNYQTKCNLLQKQLLCLHFFLSPQKQNPIQISQSILKHWNDLQSNFKKCGLSLPFQNLFGKVNKRNFTKLEDYLKIDNQLQKQTNLVKQLKTQFSRQINNYAVYVSDTIRNNTCSYQNQEFNKYCGSSIFTQCERTPKLNKQPIKSIVSALGNIINSKNLKKHPQNKQNFTIKLNNSKKSPNRSAKKSIMSYTNSTLKTSCFEPQSRSHQQQSYVLYGGVNSKQLFEIFSLNEIQNKKKILNSELNWISASQHQQFGLVPHYFANDSFFSLGGRMHGQAIDCIFKITFDQKRQLIGHLSQAKSNFGITSQKQDPNIMRVYVAGGANDIGETLRKVEVLSINYQKSFMSSIQHIKTEFMPSMNTKRSLFSLVIHQNYLYAVGGANESSRALPTVQRINLKSNNKWQFIGDLNQQRCMHSCISLPSGMYCVGGWNQSYYLNSIQKLDENQLKFRIIFRMREQKSLFGISQIENGEKIIIFGGMNENGPLDTCQIVDPIKRSSSVIPQKISSPNYYFGCLLRVGDNFV